MASSDNIATVVGDWYHVDGKNFIQAAMIYRTDLPEVGQDETLYVFDNIISGTGRISSVTKVTNFTEFHTKQFTDGYIVKLQTDTTRGRKIPFSTIYLRVPDVPSSIIHYRPGASVYFYGSLANHFNGGKILLDSLGNLPIFIQSSSTESPAPSRPQGFARFKRSNSQSPAPAKRNKTVEDDEVVVKIEPGTITPTPPASITPPSNRRPKTLAKKKKVIVESDEEDDEETGARDSDDEPEEEIIDLTVSDGEFIDDSEVNQG